MKTRRTLKIAGICVISIVFLLALYILSLIGGSDYTVYPNEKASFWVCNEPHIVLHFAKVNLDGYIEWDGEKIPIVIGLQSSVFDVYRAVPSQGVLRYENILFRGYWHYEGKNMVVEICEDNIFAGAYGKLIFTPQ